MLTVFLYEFINHRSSSAVWKPFRPVSDWLWICHPALNWFFLPLSGPLRGTTSIKHLPHVAEEVNLSHLTKQGNVSAVISGLQQLQDRVCHLILKCSKLVSAQILKSWPDTGDHAGFLVSFLPTCATRTHHRRPSLPHSGPSESLFISACLISKNPFYLKTLWRSLFLGGGGVKHCFEPWIGLTLGSPLADGQVHILTLFSVFL